MSLRGLIAPMRASSLALTSSRPIARSSVVRTFHASSSALKKKRIIEEDNIEEDVEEEDEGDLFGSTSSIPVSSGRKGLDPQKALERAQIKEKIKQIAILQHDERKHPAIHTRRSVLHRYVQLVETREDLEELRGVLRAWRVMGRPVGYTTLEEIVGRSLALGRYDFVFELANDPLQYGLPQLSPQLLNKLHTAYLQTPQPAPALPRLGHHTRLTESSAILRLAAYEHWARSHEKNIHSAKETPAEEKEIKARKVEPIVIVQKMLKEGLVGEVKDVSEVKESLANTEEAAAEGSVEIVETHEGRQARAQQLAKQGRQHRQALRRVTPPKVIKRVEAESRRLEQRGGQWQVALQHIRKAAKALQTA